MSEEIIICGKCKGRGIVDKSELTDYHNGRYDNWTEMCPECKGSGRKLVITETKVEEIPYVTPKPESR